MLLPIIYKCKGAAHQNICRYYITNARQGAAHRNMTVRCTLNKIFHIITTNIAVRCTLCATSVITINFKSKGAEHRNICSFQTYRLVKVQRTDIYFGALHLKQDFHIDTTNIMVRCTFK